MLAIFVFRWPILMTDILWYRFFCLLEKTERKSFPPPWKKLERDLSSKQRKSGKELFTPPPLPEKRRKGNHPTPTSKKGQNGTYSAYSWEKTERNNFPSLLLRKDRKKLIPKTHKKKTGRNFLHLRKERKEFISLKMTLWIDTKGINLRKNTEIFALKFKCQI